MKDFINNFVQYEGISQRFPSQVSCFKCITHSFFIDLPDLTLPIYTLNRVVVKSNTCQIDSSIQHWPTSHHVPSKSLATLPITINLEVTIYYTTCDFKHSIHSTTYSFSILDAIHCTQLPNHFQNLNPSLYVQDIFAYCLDSTHIYGYILLLVNLSS